jgi:protein involved in polysaccharide export with SLBB domain
VAALLLLTVGCGGPKRKRPVELPPSFRETVREYVIQPYDRLDVRFLYNPEFDEEVQVRPDGRLSLPLAHEVLAAGLTPAELTEVLNDRYSSELRDPHATVIVRTFSHDRIYVGGAVVEPKLIQLEGMMTALQAVYVAGGFNDEAKPEQVILIRRSPERTPMAIELNLADAEKGRDLSQDVTLEAFDVIYVPRSHIANANRFMQQYIRNMLPLRFGFGFSYRLFEE